jgi:RNA polymerase sigma-70 factor (ECF subfamily)
LFDSQPADRSPQQIAEWIGQARKGSGKALGELMQFSRQYMLLIANEELPDQLRAKGGASDLVQDAQLEATRAFADFQGQSAPELLAWLREILLHNLQDFTRRFTQVAKRQVFREIPLADLESKANRAAGLQADESTPSSPLHRQELAQKIESALMQLPEDYRQVILWRHREGLSFEEISQRLGRSVGAARKLWSRAVQQLQHRLRSLHAPD